MIQLKIGKYLFIAFPVLFFFFLNFAVIAGLYFLFQAEKASALNEDTLPNSYSLFSSKPRVLGVISQSVEQKEAASEVIKQFMQRYNASEGLINNSDMFVTEAKKYNISPWLAVAIGMCEGNLGKATPQYDGEETYNTWGWAASEKDLEEQSGSYDLKSWEKAIETVILGLATSPYYQPYTNNKELSFNDVENIMRYYAPPSVLKGGPWAKCVWQYYQELEEFKSDL